MNLKEQALTEWNKLRDLLEKQKIAEIKEWESLQKLLKEIPFDSYDQAREFVEALIKSVQAKCADRRNNLSSFFA